ncbi:hypothetical protein [Pelomonas sp. KK5]|uniref:DUF6881 domain-containing protein n=1 Tax=Pelomonas sp. KK5 TaxID=1855730 RepID=UPI00097BB4B6|nr:hypothetical protein [Pelomonas sp. KK5]
MQYIDVQWFHEHAGEPVRLVSELDCERFELRKLEFFRDGTVGAASANGAAHGTSLGTVPVPALDEINGDPAFSGAEVPPEVFEELWRLYAPFAA